MKFFTWLTGKPQAPVQFSPLELAYLAQCEDKLRQNIYRELWNKDTASFGSDGATTLGALYHFAG